MIELLTSFDYWISDSRALNTLVSLMVLDILCGVFVSIGKGTLSSSTSWRGMSKKAITLLIVLTANVLQALTQDSIPLFKIVVGFYCITEAISILENAAASGVPLPKALVDILIKLKQDAVQKSATIAVSPPVVVVTPTTNHRQEATTTTATPPRNTQTNELE